jgi:hypothetical protein
MDYADPEYAEYIEQFDHIFWEVNNGRLVDFFPSVLPLMRGVMAELAVRCSTIRRYVLSHIVEPRTREQRAGNLLDCLLQRVEDDEHSQVPVPHLPHLTMSQPRFEIFHFCLLLCRIVQFLRSHMPFLDSY